jgi:hypothetical protein
MRLVTPVGRDESNAVGVLAFARPPAIFFLPLQNRIGSIPRR